MGLNYREKEIDVARALDETEERIEDMDFTYMAPARKDWTVERLGGEEDREGFLKGVEAVRAEIIKGNLLQGVLSRRCRCGPTCRPSRRTDRCAR